MKNTLKKLLCTVIAVVAVFSMTACGRKDDADHTPDKEPEISYTDYYALTQVQIDDDIWMDTDMHLLGYIDNFIGYTSENGGTFFFMNSPLEFTAEGADFIVNGTNLQNEKTETGMTIYNGNVKLVYEKRRPQEKEPRIKPRPGIYELSSIHYDDVVKDSGSISVSRENAGCYIEIKEDGTAVFCTPEGSENLTVEENNLVTATGETINYLFRDYMIVLYFDDFSTNTYTITDTIPSKLANTGHYSIKSITIDGVVYDSAALAQNGLGTTALDVISNFNVTLTMPDKTYNLKILGRVLAGEDFNLYYTYTGDTLVAEADDMLLEFRYEG